MSVPRGQVTHVGLEVLDDPAVVCRGDVRAGVVVLQCTDRALVRLDNRLKIECKASP